MHKYILPFGLIKLSQSIIIEKQLSLLLYKEQCLFPTFGIKYAKERKSLMCLAISELLFVWASDTMCHALAMSIPSVW